MTIAFGVACEDGVLLATDSITTSWLNGRPLSVAFSRKESRLGSSIAYVLSGIKPPGWEPREEWAELPLEQLATRMLGELAAYVPASIKTPAGWDLRERGNVVLMAGGRPGSEPGLLLAGRDPAPRSGVVGGRPLVDGAIGHWAEEESIDFGAAPRTLATAIDYTLSWCRRYVTTVVIACIKEFGGIFPTPGGGIPPSFPPYHLTVLRTSGITTNEVES